MLKEYSCMANGDGRPQTLFRSAARISFSCLSSDFEVWLTTWEDLMLYRLSLMSAIIWPSHPQPGRHLEHTQRQKAFLNSTWTLQRQYMLACRSQQQPCPMWYSHVQMWFGIWSFKPKLPTYKGAFFFFFYYDMGIKEDFRLTRLIPWAAPPQPT